MVAEFAEFGDEFRGFVVKHPARTAVAARFEERYTVLGAGELIVP